MGLSTRTVSVSRVTRYIRWIQKRVSTQIGNGFGAGIGIGPRLFLNGTFFGFGGDLNPGTNIVYTINTTTGVATEYGTYSLGTGNNSSIIGAAIHGLSVPEPSTFILGISAIVLTGMVTAVRRASR